MKQKVEITIEKGTTYAYSVGFNARNYGSGSPCDTEEEVKRVIKSCEEWIKREGDIPIVKDLRVKVVQTTLI